MSKEIKTKKKEVINEAVDIILNTEDDKDAVKYLRETVEDDFPDLDLGKMDLHEAIGVLGGDEPSKKSGKNGFENINKALEMFTKRPAKKPAKRAKSKRRKRT